jgi:hypothetical protein
MYLLYPGHPATETGTVHSGCSKSENLKQSEEHGSSHALDGTMAGNQWCLDTEVADF